MKETLKRLIEKYGGNKNLNLDTNRENENYYYNKYKILEELLGDKIVPISDSKAINDYYGEENAKFLTPVDFVIARIIATLQSVQKKNVFKEYESKIVLGRNEPEYIYMIEEVKDFLEKS